MFYRWICLWGNVGYSLYICVCICKTWSYFVDYQCNPRIVQTLTWAITAWEKLLQRIPTFTVVFLLPSCQSECRSQQLAILIALPSTPSSPECLLHAVAPLICLETTFSNLNLCPLFSKAFPAPPFLSLPISFGYIYLFQVLNHRKLFICRGFLVLSLFTYRLCSPSCRPSIGWQRQKCPQRAVEKKKPDFL